MDSTPSSLIPEQTIDAFLDDLRALVTINSGTYTPAGVAQVAAYLRQLFEQMGCEVELLPGDKMGPQLVARHTGTGQGRVLIIGHMDTVFPDGEADRRPFDIHDECAYGPGVFDMKSGVLVAIYAICGLIEAGEAPWQTLTMICNSDEEIGSPESHELIEAEAKRADVALVLEPTSDVARVTIARKGAATFTLEIHGVAAHAGVEPHRGRSAILEMAHRIVALHALNGTIPGVTVNVGVVQGGERPNIVAEAAYAEIDVRAADEEGVQAIEAALAQVVADTERARHHRHAGGLFRAPPVRAESRERASLRAGRRGRRRAWALRCGASRRAARPMATRRRGWACRRWTGWGWWAAWRTTPANTSRSPRLRRVSRC